MQGVASTATRESRNLETESDVDSSHSLKLSLCKRIHHSQIIQLNHLFFCLRSTVEPGLVFIILPPIFAHTPRTCAHSPVHACTPACLTCTHIVETMTIALELIVAV